MFRLEGCKRGHNRDQNTTLHLLMVGISAAIGLESIRLTELATF